MATWLQSHIFVVLSANFAKLKCSVHLAVKFILLLRDLNMTFRQIAQKACQVWVGTFSIWKQIATKS